MKAIILDDEPRAAQSLQKMLGFVAPEVNVLVVFHDPLEALEKLPEFKPDLLFLDISMPHMTGFELLERLGKVDFEVVFTTAHDEFAVKAFRLAAVDYLLKPIDMDELLAAVKKVKTRLDSRSANSPAPGLLPIETLFRQMLRPGRLALPTAEGLIFLELANILRLESDSNYTIFYTLKKEKIIISKTLKEFEELLTGSHFFRIHNSHIVNLLQIERYMRGEGGTVVMSDRMEIEVSRRRKEDFLKKLEETSIR